jgi:hypothetical protein
VDENDADADDDRVPDHVNYGALALMMMRVVMMMIVMTMMIMMVMM